jgi:16S rRNA (adenine1518-N6/adenine1519-N6)-dimethyltransferase
MTVQSRTPRQTLSYLRNLFGAHGIKPKNKLGQCFLIDLNLFDVIVRAAELSYEDVIVEVGSGTGGLTSRLAEEAGAVLGVEVDTDFFALACETVARREHVRIMHADILKNKNMLNPGVLEAITQMQNRAPGSKLKLVANLPYSVATPVIANFLLSDVQFERMVVMVQWEIAERLMAAPNTKDYGALAVLVQSIADIEAVRRQVLPSVFWPRPKVSSAILCIRPNATKRAHVGDVRGFREFLRSLYAHRRKNLRGALAAFADRSKEKADIDRTLTALGIDGALRAETLDLEQHLRLHRAFANNSNDLLAAVAAEPHVTAEDVAELDRAIADGRRPSAPLDPFAENTSDRPV